MSEHKIIFDHFIHLQPTTWKRQGSTWKFRWSDKKQMQGAKERLGWEVKAAEPALRCDSRARFGYIARFFLRFASDGDNLEKLLLDALAGIVWENDEQVDEGQWSKTLRDGHEFGIKLVIYRINP